MVRGGKKNSLMAFYLLKMGEWRSRVEQNSEWSDDAPRRGLLQLEGNRHIYSSIWQNAQQIKSLRENAIKKDEMNGKTYSQREREARRIMMRKIFLSEGAKIYWRLKNISRLHAILGVSVLLESITRRDDMFD